MPLTPIERKAAFAHAAVLKQQSRADGARFLGVSYTHLNCVLGGEREGSAELEERIAEYCGMTVRQFWGTKRVAA